MTTVQQTIDRIQRSYLLTNQREERNRLAANISAGATSVTFDFDLAGITPNTRIALGLEDMHVWATAESSKTATVQRGDGGTTAASHTSGERVWVAPRFSPYDMFVQVNNELADLSSPVNGLYQRKTTDITLVSNVLAYNLPSDLVDVLDVYYSTDSFSEAWLPLGRRGWRFQSGLPVSEFASGMALTLPGFSPNWDVRVVYKAAFTPVTALTNDLTTFSGLPATAQDIVEMGVALRIAAPKAIQRAFTGGQGDTRRADEVSTSDVLQAPGRLAQLRQSRIAAEAARLKQQNGV